MPSKFRKEQLEKLSSLFMDLAKGLILSAIAIPAISPQTPVTVSFQALGESVIFVYISMWLIKIKEVKYSWG